jgi:S1-C subfamily serine protease
MTPEDLNNALQSAALTYVREGKQQDVPLRVNQELAVDIIRTKQYQHGDEISLILEARGYIKGRLPVYDRPTAVAILLRRDALSKAVEGQGRVCGSVIASAVLPQKPAAASVSSLGLTTATRANMGAQITEVASGGMAERAYLHVGDVISAVDGRPVKTTMELEAALSNRTPGSKIRIGYMLSTGLGYFTKEVIVTLAQNR